MRAARLGPPLCTPWVAGARGAAIRGYGMYRGGYIIAGHLLCMEVCFRQESIGGPTCILGAAHCCGPYVHDHAVTVTASIECSRAARAPSPSQSIRRSIGDYAQVVGIKCFYECFWNILLMFWKCFGGNTRLEHARLLREGRRILEAFRQNGHSHRNQLQKGSR